MVYDQTHGATEVFGSTYRSPSCCIAVTARGQQRSGSQVVLCHSVYRFQMKSSPFSPGSWGHLAGGFFNWQVHAGKDRPASASLHASYSITMLRSVCNLAIYEAERPSLTVSPSLKLNQPSCTCQAISTPCRPLSAFSAPPPLCDSSPSSSPMLDSFARLPSHCLLWPYTCKSTHTHRCAQPSS